MNKIVIDIFMYIFESLLLFYYSNTLFEPRKSKTASFIFTVFANAVLCIIYQFGIVYLNGIALMVLYVMMFALLYKTTFKSAIFHSAIFIIIMFASELLVMGIGTAFFDDFNAMENNKYAYLYVVMTSKIIYFAIMMAILKLFAKRGKKELGNKYFWLLFFVPFTSILMMLSLRYIAYITVLPKSMDVLLTVSTVFVLFSNILVFIIYEYSRKNTEELFELKTIQHQEEQDKKYFEVIEQSNKEMRVLAHDMKNHLTQIRNLDKINDVQKYIDGLMPDLDRFSYTGISKNKMLDLILSKYITLCESKNIKIEIDSKTANLSYIDDVDLSTLMNNLLDNAVEAAEQAKNGYIQIYIFSKNDLYDGLIIRNSCVNSPETNSGELKTTKRNKKLHGIGVRSIKKIIKKYNALYDWKFDKSKNIFETDIVFPKLNK